MGTIVAFVQPIFSDEPNKLLFVVYQLAIQVSITKLFWTPPPPNFLHGVGCYRSFENEPTKTFQVVPKVIANIPNVTSKHISG